MALRPEYSLGHSAYNDFLHGPVGQDASGTELSVLSALTRLGIDPWQEAARLADLPRDVAATALAATLARLPDLAPADQDRGKDAGAIARRLVATLPDKSAPTIPQTPQARTSARTAAASVLDRASGFTLPGMSTWLMWGALALAFYFLLVQMTPDRELEPAQGRETTQQR